MLRGVQANVAQRRALSQLYQTNGVAPGTVDVVSDITFWPKPSCIPAKGVGPKAQTWAWPAQIRARSCAGNPTLWDFRKNAKHLMCELTTGWIFWNFRCSNRSGMLIGDPLCDGSNASSTNSELWRAENSFLRGNSTLRSGAQGTNQGLTNSNKGTKLRT